MEFLALQPRSGFTTGSINQALAILMINRCKGMRKELNHTSAAHWFQWSPTVPSCRSWKRNAKLSPDCPPSCHSLLYSTQTDYDAALPRRQWRRVQINPQRVKKAKSHPRGACWSQQACLSVRPDDGGVCPISIQIVFLFIRKKKTLTHRSDCGPRSITVWTLPYICVRALRFLKDG